MKMVNKIICGSIAIAAVIAFSASTTQAQPNLIVNPGFEGVGAVNTGNGWTVNPITLTSGPGAGSGVNQGWATFDTAVQSDMSSSTFFPNTGSYALGETIAAGNNWETPGAYQIVTGITPGQTYKFSAWAVSDTGAIWVGALVQLGFETPALGGATTVENPGNTVGISALPSTSAWTQYSVTATAPAGCTDAIVYLMFQDYNNITFNQPIPTDENIYFDDASLTVVPEPSSLALLAMGLGMPFYFLRRRKS